MFRRGFNSITFGALALLIVSFAIDAGAVLATSPTWRTGSAALTQLGPRHYAPGDPALDRRMAHQVSPDF